MHNYCVSSAVISRCTSSGSDGLRPMQAMRPHRATDFRGLQIFILLYFSTQHNTSSSDRFQEMNNFHVTLIFFCSDLLIAEQLTMLLVYFRLL